MRAKLAWILLMLILAYSACKKEVNEAKAEEWMQRAEELVAQAAKQGIRDQKTFLNQSIRLYTKAIEYNPKLELAYMRRGAANLILEKYDRAIDDFTKVIALSPNNRDAYYGRAACYDQQHNSGAASQDFRKACELGSKAACIQIQE
jgi:tetratricopeptide (TPR) repeat protein